MLEHAYTVARKFKMAPWLERRLHSTSWMFFHRTGLWPRWPCPEIWSAKAGQADRRLFDGVDCPNKQSGVERLEDEIKRYPVRIINAGVADTLQRASALGLVITPEIEAISYELAAVRDSVTSTALAQSRPELPCTRANKHFFALEFIESRFMVAFLRELRKRDRCASIIWLHDGLWVQRS